MKSERKRKRQSERNRGSRRMASKVGHCGAKKRQGGTCHLAAGFGTDHHGIGHCKYHGGNLPTHKLNALKQEAVFMGAPKEINAVDAIIWCIHITAGEIEWFNERMAELDRSEWYENTVIGKQLHILARERASALMRLEKFSKDALALDIAERRVRLAEQYGSTIARLLKGVMEDLQLTAEQQKRAPEIIRKHLILLESARPGELPQVAAA